MWPSQQSFHSLVENQSVTLKQRFESVGYRVMIDKFQRKGGNDDDYDIR